MVFRPLTIQDKNAIAVVLNSRAQSPVVGVSWTLDSILAELNGSSHLFGCWVHQARRVEVQTLEAFVLFKDLGSVLEVLLIYSDKKANGAAGRAFEALMHACPDVEEIWLEVHEENQAAIRFYEQRGFVRVSRRSNYYPDGKAALNYNLILKS